MNFYILAYNPKVIPPEAIQLLVNQLNKENIKVFFITHLDDNTWPIYILNSKNSIIGND